MGAKMSIEQDKDGYPLHKSLKEIAEWTHKKGWHKLMEYIADYFNDGYGRCKYRDIDNTWEVATGGWSGCEEVISALKQNQIFWLMCWYLSKRGGYYEFRIK